MTDAEREIGIRDLRRDLAEVVNDVAVRREIVYVTNYHRRYAAIVPLTFVEDAQKRAAEPSDAELIEMLRRRPWLLARN